MTFEKYSNSTLVITVLITVLGGSFQFGYQMGGINQPQIKITKFIKNNLQTYMQISDFLVVVFWSLAVSVFCLGGMIGGLMGCRIADTHGRKKCLIGAAMICILGEISQGLTLELNSYFLLVIGRLITGVGCGLFTAVVPLYLTEIAPPVKRGLIGSLNQIMIVVGVIVSQTLGLEFILGSEKLWPFLLALSSFSAVLLILVLPFCPSSPYFLIFFKDDIEGSIRSLRRLRCTHDVDGEILQIYEEKSHLCSQKTSLREFFRDKNSRRSLGVALSLHISQQFSGINSIIFYSTSIFIMAGLSLFSASLATIALGVVQLITTIVSSHFIDRTGRRPILLASLTGSTVCLLLLTITLLFKTVYAELSYASIVVLILYVAFFGFGTGSIPWLMTPELFTPNDRDVGISLGVFSNWLFTVMVANLYPIIQNKLGIYSFLPFVFSSVIFIGIIYRFCPETTVKLN